MLQDRVSCQKMFYAANTRYMGIPMLLRKLYHPPEHIVTMEVNFK